MWTKVVSSRAQYWNITSYNFEYFHELTFLFPQSKHWHTFNSFTEQFLRYERKCIILNVHSNVKLNCTYIFVFKRNIYCKKNLFFRLKLIIKSTLHSYIQNLKLWDKPKSSRGITLIFGKRFSYICYISYKYFSIKDLQSTEKFASSKIRLRFRRGLDS